MKISRLDKKAGLDGYEDPNVAVVVTMKDDGPHCPLCGKGRGVAGDRRGRLMSYTCDRCDYGFSEAVRQAGKKGTNYRKKIKASLKKKEPLK